MKPARLSVTWWAALAATVVTAATTVFMVAPANAATIVTYANPLAEQRADPQIFRHTDGYYYFTATVPEYDRIILRRSKTLTGLANAAEKVIWRKHRTGEMGAHIWAPEIHYIDGKWYIYFAAGRTEDIWAIRPYVLETAAANPLDGPWTEKGQIQPARSGFSLDATTFVHKGIRYLAWAQAAPGVSSNIYLAKMTNPWTIEEPAGGLTPISTPTLAWERRGYNVNEGPAVIERNGRLFMTYSASATDSNYCLGLLTASADSDPLDPASWAKSPEPIFTSSTATSQYGPGHNSFTVSEDGKSDILVYHSRNYKREIGDGYDPLGDVNRRTRIQKVYWNADGTPNLGIPVPDGVTPVRLSAHNFPDRYVRHSDFRAGLQANVAELADSQFRLVRGLAKAGAVSLESTNLPGYFLRHRGDELWLDRRDGSEAFKNDATFVRRPGLADADKLSLESLNSPGRFVRHRDGVIVLSEVPTAADKQDATFNVDPSVPSPPPAPPSPSGPASTSPSTR